MNGEVYPTGVGLCPVPIRFELGQFTGLTIRAGLTEIQKADLGRKYARVDRRPLDPPPVVKATFCEVIGDNRLRELEHGEIQILGLLCTVDLFPVIDPDSPGTRSGHKRSYSTSSSSTTTSNGYSPTTSYSSRSTTNGSGAPNDVIHWVGNIPITESSKVTDALVGATFVQPQFIDLESKKALIFVFPDLAVKNEGTFLLRYRMFDLFSKAEGRDDRPIQAECYGGPFRVYSTKEFPGLQASTELTKLISRYGVRLNIRETERKRRRKTGNEPFPAAQGEKRKHSSRDDDDDDDDSVWT
ncbi:hypothetical protein BT96DRAFT_810687 [Gymnopus androsaceus JB14]|uniref:Velvet domain-containing protein n=1 Tax=Gymnopus androsaceus JB14 TaxID=1447944 RepID=A0A6A4I756_9AGAR|nr:hypothetical protein BT96DRAFT_810687 [Gymnopus androsaceus JB14]